MSKSGRPAQSVYQRTRESIGAHLMIDGLRAAVHTLRHGLNADGAASLVTQESGWIVRAAWRRGMMLGTQLASKNY